MKIKLFSLIIALFVAILIVYLIKPIRDRRRSGPIASIPVREVDLGEANGAETLRGSFIIKNKGSSLLTYKLAKSCGCTELSPMEGSIARGASRDISIGIHLGVDGVDKNVTIKVDSNDPINPSQFLHVHARRPYPFDCEPLSIDFGSISRADKPSIRTIHLSIRKNNAGFIVVKSFPNRFKLKQKIGRNGVEEIVIESTPDSEDDYLLDHLVLEDVKNHTSMKIPISAHIVDQISAAPHYLNPTSITSNPDVLEGRFLVFRNDGSPIGKMIGVEHPSEIEVRRVDSNSKSRLMFTARIHKNRLPSSPCMIAIQIEGVDRPAIVTIIPPVKR